MDNRGIKKNPQQYNNNKPHKQQPPAKSTILKKTNEPIGFFVLFLQIRNICTYIFKQLPKAVETNSVLAKNQIYVGQQENNMT